MHSNTSGSDDQFLDPTFDVEIVVLVKMANVPCSVLVAIRRERRPGLGLVVFVAHEDVSGSGRDLALAAGVGIQNGIDDAGITAAHRS